MKNKDFNEEEIAQLLSSMPKIHDKQNKEALFRKVKHSLDHEKKKRRYFTPGVAVAFALILISIISISLFKNNDFLSTGSMNESKEEAKMDRKVESFDNEEMSILMEDQPFGKTSVYQEDLVENEDIFVYGVPDENFQNIIPITIIHSVNEEQSWIENYNSLMPKLKEEEWGLTEYYPIQGAFSKVDDETLKLNAKENHPYGMSSASESIFFNSLTVSFQSQGVRKIDLYTNNEPGILFGNTGKLTTFDINQSNKHGYFFYQTDNGYFYLVPYPNPFETIDEAFTAMKSKVETHNLLPSIPENVTFQNNNSGDTLNIEFTDQTTLEPSTDTIRMFEAILLTAKEFGYDQVIFSNTGFSEIGDFVLTKPIQVPISPNKIQLN